MRLKYHDFDSSMSARAAYYAAMGGSGSYKGSASQNRWMIEEMKKHKFQQGGTIGSLIKQTGEDGFVLARSGEEILSLEKIKELQGALSLLNGIENTVSTPGLNSISNGRNVTNNNDISLNINLPDVTDVNSFITELQSNKRFEKIVQAITIDTSLGKNTLNKYKY